MSTTDSAENVNKELYLRVDIISCDDNGQTYIREFGNNDGFGLWVNNDSLKDEADILKIKEDRTEEYRSALQKFAEMDVDLREKVFGSYKLADIAKMQPEEFISKINEYNYIPQTGEIWETVSREKVVVVSVGIGEINFYSSRATQKGCSEQMSLADFKKIFHNTGKTCDTLIAFFEELGALNGTMYF
jgi:hypothetical protein